MKFKELDEILQLRLKKSCRLNESLNGWLPSSEDYVYMKDDEVVEIFSNNLEIEFKDNNITSVNKY
jgi:hypothetical protein